MAGAMARDTLDLVSLQPHLPLSHSYYFIDDKEDRPGCSRPRECGRDHDHGTEGEQGGEEEDEVGSGRVELLPQACLHPTRW